MNQEPAAIKMDLLMAKLSDVSDISLSDFIDEQIIDDIILDWGGVLSRLEKSALQIKSDPGDENALNEIKKALHSIKGEGAVYGLEEVSEVFRQMEIQLEIFIKDRVCPAEMLLKIKAWLQQILEIIASEEWKNSRTKA